MSRFRIYRIDYFDPEIAGRKMRRKVINYAFIFSFLALAIIVLHGTIKINIVLLLAIGIPLIIAPYLYIFNKLGSEIKHTKAIGEIEFTRTCIKKKIGDFMTEYEFSSIKKIELQKHFPEINMISGLSGNFTYILKIIFINSTSESLVVSDKPIDSKLNICIVETMKTLKKIIDADITIEY
jgi:hypothetical protein